MTEFEYNVIHQLKIHNKIAVLKLRSRSEVIRSADLATLDVEIDKTISFPCLHPSYSPSDSIAKVGK